MTRAKLHEIEPYSRGDIQSRDGSCLIDYYTVQPAPTQWVAIGRVVRAPEGLVNPGALLAASERSESEAIERLGVRCPKHTEGMHP